MRQVCADYERTDVIKLQAAPGQFLLPREQLNASNPLRCEFATWTAGSFLQVDASAAFNVIQSAATLPTIFVGSHRIAIDLGAGWKVAKRTGRTFGEMIQVAPAPAAQAATVAHALVLGPFDVPPKVAIVCSWSLDTGAHMQTGLGAASVTFQPMPGGLSLVCAELDAACVLAAQPPELEAVTLVDPRFAP